jgi:hypothetical protein
MTTVRRPRFSRLGALLALVAMLGFFALSSWHNAIVHDDDPVHLVSVEHDHGSSAQTDPDAPIHVLAHATGQWIDIAGPISKPLMFTAAPRLWSIGVFHLRGAIEPAGLLRPPRG